MSNDEQFENEELLKKVGAYVDGELPPEEREAMENQLQTNANYREAAGTYRWLDDLASRDTVPEVTGEEWARVWDRINEQKGRELQSAPLDSTDSFGHGESAAEKIIRPRFGRLVMGVAAALAIAVVGFAFYYGNQSPQVVETPDAQNRAPVAELRLEVEVIEGPAPEIDDENMVRYKDF